MSLQDKHGNPLAESLRFTIDIGMPPSMSLPAYQAWAPFFIEASEWPSYDLDKHYEGELDPEVRLLINSHLCLWEVFYELGRLPIFDIFEIQSLTLKDPVKKIYRLEVDFLKLDFIALKIYQIPLGFSLKLTQWMAQEEITQKNLHTLYKSIEEEVVQSMHRLVPGGQSTIPVLKAAYQQKIPFTHLGLGVYQLGWGSRAQRLDRSASQADAMMGAKLSQNKIATAQLLRMAGLPVPEHVLVYGERDAQAAAQTLNYPVVVKPADQDRGEGVTVEVDDQDKLRRAFGLAQWVSRSKEVIVERHVPGVCHRLMMVGGQLLYCVKRQPMGVWGDGVRTIEELVEDELARQTQKPIWHRSKIQGIDTLAKQAFESQGITSDSIPGAGAFVSLRTIESTEWGGVDEDMTALVHPDNIQIAIQASRLLNLQIAGVDIISMDIATPWHENGAVINEVNFAPLLGGAEISRSYLPRFFNYLFRGTHTIPLDLFDDEALARQRRDSLIQQQLRAYFVNAHGIEDPWGKMQVMSHLELRARIKALMCCPDVDAVVACVY
jgi:D-alanine-D-alanine ligase-like ATP-grasp enzyme